MDTRAALFVALSLRCVIVVRARNKKKISDCFGGMNCVICAIAKLENDYLYEWAAYHIGLGFSHIYLYDNNDADGERPQDVFSATPLQNRVTVIDVRGKKYQQLCAYQHCADTYLYDWCAYIDIDEFITFAADSGLCSITDYLCRFSPSVHAVHLNWLCYGDCGHIRKQKPILSHYRHPIKPLDFCFTYDDMAENAHIKSIVRGGIPCDWLHNPTKGQITPHTPFVCGNVANARGGGNSEHSIRSNKLHTCFYSALYDKVIGGLLYKSAASSSGL